MRNIALSYELVSQTANFQSAFTKLVPFFFFLTKHILFSLTVTLLKLLRQGTESESATENEMVQL